MGIYGSPQADLNLYSNISPYHLSHESIILIIIIYHKCLILSPWALTCTILVIYWNSIPDGHLFLPPQHKVPLLHLLTANLYFITLNTF